MSKCSPSHSQEQVEKAKTYFFLFSPSINLEIIVSRRDSFLHFWSIVLIYCVFVLANILYLYLYFAQVFFSGSAQVEKGFLCRALADIPLPVVLASLTRSLSNANIPPNTEEENTVSKIQLQYDRLA